MVRTANPALAKVFAKADRGTDLFTAWQQCGEPTTWGNVLRAY